MHVSQKCQYAVRAVFELASRDGQGPVTVGEIAEAQAIPAKFLELILGELKQTGYVASRRGAQGGYLLAVSPDGLTAGDVIRSVDGSFDPVQCISEGNGASCRLKGDCVFMGLWQRAGRAIAQAYDSTTFQDLVDEHEEAAGKFAPNYSI